MRISRELARTIAVSLTDKLAKGIEQRRKDLDSEILQEHLKSIPKAIKDIDAAHPGWINRTKTITVRFSSQGRGIAYFVETEKDVIDHIKDLKAPNWIRKKIIGLRNEESKLRELKNEITRVVISLRTSKKVIEHFPETAPFFNEKKRAILAVHVKANLSNLKAKLQKQ